jgi:hypothetical protein
MLGVDVHEFNVSFFFVFVNCHSVKNCVFVNCELLVLRFYIVRFYDIWCSAGSKYYSYEDRGKLPATESHEIPLYEVVIKPRWRTHLQHQHVSSVEPLYMNVSLNRYKGCQNSNIYCHRHLCLSWARLIQSMPPQRTSWKPIYQRSSFVAWMSRRAQSGRRTSFGIRVGFIGSTQSSLSWWLVDRAS